MLVALFKAVRRTLWAIVVVASHGTGSVAMATRAPVLGQVELPHSYYYREMYLPQLTSGPSSVDWSPDSVWLVFSMQGSLWRQRVDGGVAEQLTAGPGYDYQPDWSPSGEQVVFVRYLDDAMELYLLDVATGAVTQLTRGGAVNVDPRWSPDSRRIAWVSTQNTGHFRVQVAGVENGELVGSRPLRPERRSNVERYYYSAFDHELSPVWLPSGEELVIVSNPEIPYGTGGLWRLAADGSGLAQAVRLEETTWKARPDVAPDGRRVLYSSYLGRQWHQLWVTTSDGGQPLPLTYGDHDVTAARWSPDGSRIVFVSNEDGNPGLFIQEWIGGARRRIELGERRYLAPMGALRLLIEDTAGAPVPARVAVGGADGRSYAPDAAWIHADDGFDRGLARFETQYFHSDGGAALTVPAGPTTITVWRGLEHRIAVAAVEVSAGEIETVRVRLEPFAMPQEWLSWTSGDVHVHMNYGGAYRNTPERLVRQALAEDLDVVFNLIVNKEQRIPDISYFSPSPDPASSAVLLLHGQEYHTSFWGHLGLLGLQHYLVPDYSAYPHTAAASLQPTNGVIADLTHRQQGLVGYVHPFDFMPDPEGDAPLTYALPIDVALGKVDYYEVVGFSDHRTTASIWHRLLDCGFRVAAAAGTDAMANFASLRGPVGVNRVYVKADPGGAAGRDLEARERSWLAALAAGRSMATNGALLGLTVEGRDPGSEIELPAGRHRLRYRGFLRSIVPVDHLELVLDGEVAAPIEIGGDGTAADFEGSIEVERSGWLLLRAWNEQADPRVFDLYPYATTSPVYLSVESRPIGERCDADFFLAWIDRVAAAAAEHPGYNAESERRATLAEIEAARAVFAQRQR